MKAFFVKLFGHLKRGNKLEDDSKNLKDRPHRFTLTLVLKNADDRHILAQNIRQYPWTLYYPEPTIKTSLNSEFTVTFYAISQKKAEELSKIIRKNFTDMGESIQQQK